MAAAVVAVTVVVVLVVSAVWKYAYVESVEHNLPKLLRI
jgi:hypothetical protein